MENIEEGFGPDRSAGNAGADTNELDPGASGGRHHDPAADADVLRLDAARHLANQVASLTGMVEMCDRLTGNPKIDRTKPVFAAARIAEASAEVARALTLLALGESRHRRIAETIAPPPPPDAIGDDIAATTAIAARRLRQMAEQEEAEWLENDKRFGGGPSALREQPGTAR